LLPFPSDRRPARAPILTWALLAVTAGVSIYQIIVSHNGAIESAGVAFALGLVPAHIRPFSFLTYSFVHSNVSHLLINVFYIWVFGAGLESALGKSRLLVLYLLGGAVGGALQVLVALKAPGLLNPGFPIIGASAGCACLVGLYAVRFYRDRISFVGIPYRPSVTEIVTLFLCVEAGIGLWEMFVGTPAGGVAHWAHIGGFVFGLTCAYLMHLDSEGQAAYWREDVVSALEQNQPGAAVARLEQILARDPSNANARSDMARAWRDFGDLQQASAQYIEAVRMLLAQNRRTDAAHLFKEMREALPTIDILSEGPPPAWTSTLTPELSTSQLFVVGVALEEIDAVEPAADALRAVSVRDPDSPEAETSLLKVAHIYISRLGRREEARILLILFSERYPNSPLRARAEELVKSLKA
jgi:membrane associated rhomboid family serine protease